MAVPVVVAAKRSPSLAKVPPAIRTVAAASLRLSASETVTFGASVAAAAPCVKDALAGMPDTVGALLMLVMLMVVVAAVLAALPSLSDQVTVRVGAEPSLVGCA